MIGSMAGSVRSAASRQARRGVPALAGRRSQAPNGMILLSISARADASEEHQPALRRDDLRGRTLMLAASG